MPSLGTAPRRVSPGVWKTAYGRTLTPAGGAYWENLFRTGHTDGRGHMRTPSVVQGPPPVYGENTSKVVQATKPKKPSFDTAVKAVHGDPAAKAEIQRWGMHKRREAEGIASAEHARDVGLFGAANPAVHSAYTNINPVAASMIESLSPTSWFPATGAALHGHGVNLPMIGLEAAGIFPFGRAARLGKAAEEAVQAVRRAPAGAEEVLGAVKPAKAAAAERAATLSEEKAARVKKAGEAYQIEGGGLKGQQAFMAELAGKYSEVPFNDLTHLTDDEIDGMIRFAHEDANLRPLDAGKLGVALKRMQEGKGPRPYEIRLIERAFGPDKAVEASHTKRGPLEYVADIINIPRALMATGEFSYRLRNGLFFTAMHPMGALKNTKKGFGVTFSQPRFDALQDALHTDPELIEGADLGLALTDTGHHVVGREEAFQSPIAEKITGGRVSPVRAAARNFTANSILDRAMVYKSILEEGRRDGVTGDELQWLKESAVKTANWSTGRSGWGHETAEMLTNTFLFAPKLFKTRLEALNILPGKYGFYSNLHPIARRRAIRSMVRLVAVGTGLLAIAAKYGADVELDPRSSDWGKIRIGNTRFDIWGGNQQIARTIAQVGSQATKSTSTGKIHHLGRGEAFDPVQRLFEGKLSPPMSIALDIKRGKMFAGQPLTWQAETKERLSPLLYQDIWDAWRQESKGTAGAVAGLGAFGVGTQTFKPPKPKAAGPGRSGRGRSYYSGPTSTPTSSGSRGGGTSYYTP